MFLDVIYTYLSVISKTHRFLEKIGFIFQKLNHYLENFRFRLKASLGFQKKKKKKDLKIAQSVCESKVI